MVITSMILSFFEDGKGEVPREFELELNSIGFKRVSWERGGELIVRNNHVSPETLKKFSVMCEKYKLAEFVPH